MKPVSEYKILTVLFAPALGGNHIANMISTSPCVQNRIKDVGNYEQYLIDLYVKSTGHNFHAGEFLNFGVEDYTKAYNTVSENNLTTVLPGHMEDAYWVLNHLRNLGNIGFITLEVFGIDLYNFYKKTSNRAYVKNYNPYVYRFMYTKEVASRILGIEMSDGYVIDAELLIQPEISGLLNDLNSELDLKMNLDLCKELHTIRHKKAYLSN
jgi:hypothetical protein